MATIILTGGGTAGHCTPNLALLPYLKKHFDNIYYIGSENGIEKKIVENSNVDYYGITCVKFTRNSIKKNLTIPFKLAKGIRQASKIIDKLKPDVIFSKGGYVSVPVVLAGKKRKIPIISHESDYTIGLANKITAKHCKKVLTSFPETAKMIKNGQFVGSPIRKELLIKPTANLYKEFGFTFDKPVLLVTGGSQGATVINNVLIQALDELLEKYNVIHLCGKGNLSKEIEKEGYYQAEFINNIEKAFSITSVCVTRAGSNTLFELMSMKIPCVLIPLPMGTSRGDQVLNANYFQKLGLATVLQQCNLTKDSLIYSVNSCYVNRENIKRNFEKNPITNASKKIVDEIIKEL